ncbi:MAG: hypothetical protein IH827_09275 [Myxococcales bacterium]|nr:hypothetical protein [Myxococcales bacterium]
MHGEESRRKRRRLGLVAFWLGAGLLVVAAIRSISVTDADRTGLAEEATNRPVERTIRVKTVDRHPTDPNWRRIEQGDFDLIAGETTSIAAQDLPTERPLVLNLLLPASLPSADALPVRILSMDGSGELKLPDAVVATDGDRVRVQIESGWLSPGRYRIEIETTERSQLALRRYLLEVL